MKNRKAHGIDDMSKEEYGRNLKANLENLVKRMKSSSYRPNPTRRVNIPKEAKGKMRPLGISCYEDKLVENAIAQILEQIYESKFYNGSFGFRPNRNFHMAVKEIIEMVQYRKKNYVVEADIRGFFDNVSHEWLMKMLALDIADKRFLEIIEKFLKCYITYTQSDLGYMAILKNVCGQCTMREMDENLNQEICIDTLRIMSGNQKLEEMPHYDTLNYYLERLSPECLSELRKKMVTSLIRGKQFNRNRLQGKYWRIILDGTGVFYFKEKHCENCLCTTKKTDDGKTIKLYYHKVLEAKLV